jgi:hypothetical protein
MTDERKARALDLLAAMGSKEIELDFYDQWQIGDQIDTDEKYPSLVEAIEALAKSEGVSL